MLEKCVLLLLEHIEGSKKKRKKEYIVSLLTYYISIALAKCVEEGVNHMWTVSAIQMHPKGLIVCDEDATLELHVKVESLDKYNSSSNNKVLTVAIKDCQIFQIN
jgi:hypothetical protein